MPDGTLQRKTAILVDAPRSIRTPPGVLRLPARRIAGPGRPGHALRRGDERRSSGSRKKVFGA